MTTYATCTTPPCPVDCDGACRDQPAEDPQRRRLVLTPASAIEPAPVVWAWTDGGEGRIPAGSLSVAAGREGTGKSSFGIWLAAQITQGILPGTLYGSPHAVIYAAVEDSWRYTLVPRLMAAGADLDRVFRIEVYEDESQDVTLSLPRDLLELERAIRQHDVALCVLDPLMSTIGAKIDTHRERDVRTALDPLARLADRARCLMLGIAHFSKGTGSDPSSLITGSGAFKNVPRSVFGFAVDRDDGARIMSQTKNSLGKVDLPSLVYAIQDHAISTPKGPTHVGKLVWLGESDRTVGDVLGEMGDADDRAERDEAADWLHEYLMDNGGEANRVDIMKAAKAAGFSESTLKRAKKRARVISSPRQGFGGGTLWQIDQSDHSQSSESKAPALEPTDPTVTRLNSADPGATP